jgi:hypothetical protein
MQAGLRNSYESIKAFSETDFTEDLKKFNVPTLVMHGEDDQIVPVKDSAKKSANSSRARKKSTIPALPTASPPPTPIRSTGLAGVPQNACMMMAHIAAKCALCGNCASQAGRGSASEKRNRRRRCHINERNAPRTKSASKAQPMPSKIGQRLPRNSMHTNGRKTTTAMIT